MSAFVVSNEHINALVNYGLGLTYWDPVKKWREDITTHTAETVGQILMDENQRSVNYRYNDTTEAPRFKFKQTHHIRITPVQIIKAAHCLDYQCCETEDWEQTVAHAILEEIKGKAERKLPGYEDAAWGIRPKEMA